ncbi:MAG: outer membrane beta-barrel protein, partial [Desulfobia sp.]
AGINLQARGKTGEMSLYYRPSYSLYQENDEYDSLRHNAGLNFRKNLSRHLHFTLSDSFTRSEQPYDPARDVRPPDREDAVLEEADYTLRQGREPRSTNTARTRLEYEFGPRDLAWADYSLRHFRSDNPGDVDSVRSSPGLGLEYWFARRYGLETRVRYINGSFDETEDADIFNETEDFDRWSGSLKLMRNFSRFMDGYIMYSHSYKNYSENRTDYSVYEPSAGISYRFSQDGSFSLGLGYNIRDEDNGEKDERIVLNADINQTWDFKRGSLRLRAGSGYNETHFGAENLGFTIYYQAGAYYSYPLKKRLYWDIAADYRRNDYKDAEPERKDHIISFGTGLNYQLSKRVRLSLNYDYRLRESAREIEVGTSGIIYDFRQRDSSLDRNEYRENQVMLSLSWYPRGWKLN